MNRTAQAAVLALGMLASPSVSALGISAGADYESEILTVVHSGRLKRVPGSDTVLAVSRLDPGDPQKVIIDTDPAIGYAFRDIDDGLTLVMALSDPRLEVLGVTVEFGNTSQRKAYAKAREIVELMGRGHVPVLKGSEFPRAEPSEASRFIVEQARRYPGRVKILAVGALTNLAAAIQEDPAVVNLLEEVVTVGGNLRADDRLPGEDFPYDLNYGSDPECARIVFSSGLAITLVSIELCRQFLLEWSRFRGATRRGDPVDRYLRRSTVSWFIAGAGRTVAWDVVGLSFVVHPEWFTHAQARVLFRVFQAGRPWVTLQIADDGPCLTTLLTEVENQSRFWEWLEVSL